MMLPDISPNSADLAILSAAIAAAFVIFEYGFKSPSLIEFRFAAPYNRFRIAILAALLLTIGFAFRADLVPSDSTTVIGGVAVATFDFWTFAGSPLHFFMELTTASTVESQHILGKASALALSVTVLGVFGFGASMWLFNWPLGREKFNLWTNMPTFDVSKEDETEASLRQCALMSTIIGLTLPYLAPQAALTFIGPLQPISASNSQFLVWMIAIWCFVPAVSLLRAVALYKVASLIAQDRVQSQ